MLIDTLQEDLKAAMRAKDAVRLRTVRALRAAVKEKEIELRTSGSADLTEEQVVAVLQKQAKQRRDAISQYREADREDLAEKEEAELHVIEDYLPKQLDDAELRQILEQVVSEVGAESMRDMGKVMGAAMKRVQGKADGKRVQQGVRSLLGG